MPRHFIRRFALRDETAITAIGRCGHVSHAQLAAVVSEKRILNYCRDGYIEKTLYSQPGTRERDQIAYKLTAKGRDLAEQMGKVTRCQHAQSPAHDLGIASRYFSITEQERATWQTETEITDRFHEYMDKLYDRDRAEWNRLNDMQQEHAISPPDAVYTSSQGTEIAFEVVTNSYGHAEIEAKETFSEVMELSYEQSRI